MKEGDFFVVNIRRETKTIELKFTTNVLQENRSLLKLTRRFLEIQYPWSKGKMHLELFNFEVDFAASPKETIEKIQHIPHATPSPSIR